MTVLVDTTIWSLALRRRRDALTRDQVRLVDEWRALVLDGRAGIIGPVRQEVLSGVRSTEVFDRLRHHLAGFDCIEVGLDDYDQAARFYNTLRSSGVAGGGVDLLICAVASRAGVPIFTTDRDFRRYADHLPIRLHEAR